MAEDTAVAAPTSAPSSSPTTTEAPSSTFDASKIWDDPSPTGGTEGEGAGDGSDPGDETAVAGEETTEAVVEDPIVWEFDNGEIGEPTVVDGPNGEKLYQWAEKDARAIQGDLKFATELREAVGPDYTVNDAIAHNEAYSDLLKMGHDMRTGSPDAVTRIAQTILNEGGNAAISNLTGVLVNHLKAADPAAYQQLSQGVEADLVEEFYKVALQQRNNPDKNTREAYRIAAEMLDFHTKKGVYRPLDKYNEQQQTNPIDERLKRAESLEQQHAERQKQEAARVEKTWISAVNTTSEQQLSSAIEELIPESLKKQFNANPILKPAILDRVAGQVRDRLKADTEWSGRFNIEYKRALASGNKQSAEQICAIYLARAKGIMKRELPKMLTSASSVAVAENKQKHAQLQKATGPSHRVPGQTGAVKQSLMKPDSKMKSPEDYQAEVRRLLRS